MPNNQNLPLFLLPGPCDGCLWPHQGSGLWLARMYALIYTPKDEHSDWMYAIEAPTTPFRDRHMDRPPLPLNAINEARDAFPQGWVQVRKNSRDPYPLPAAWVKPEVVNA